MRGLLAIALLVGCGPSSSKERHVDLQASLETFATKMCACTDKPCVLAVTEDLAKWSKQVVLHGTGDPPPPGAVEKSAEIMKRYNTCMAAILKPPKS
jgi:hypothetical protein